MNHSALLAAKVVRALERELRLRRGEVLSATFGMTYKCNLRCVTCGTWVRGETDTQVELTTEEILSTSRQLRELGVRLVVLVGSEPLLRKDAIAVIEGMRTLGLEVDIITNGTVLTEARARDLVRLGVHAVTVSLDGVGERHNQIRGQALAYERAMAGLRRLKDVREAAGSRRPHLAIHATISRFNTDGLEEISALSDALGLEVTFQLASETSAEEVDGSRLDGKVVAGEEFVSRDGSFLPDAPGVQRLRAFLKKPGMLKKHASLQMLASMSDEDLQAGRFPVHSCQVVRGEILIDPYGEVRPCSHLETYSYGNVRRQPVRDIWQSMERQKLVDRVGRELFPVCAKCCQHTQNLTPGQKGRMLLRSLFT